MAQFVDRPMARSFGANLPTNGGYQRVPAAPATILKQNNNNAGYSAVGSITVTTEAYPSVPYPGGPSSGLSMSVAAGVQFGSAMTAVKPFKLSEVALVGLRFYWPSDQAGSLIIAFSSDGFVSKRREFSISYSGQISNRWNTETVRPDDDGSTSPNNGTWGVTGGQAIDETITHMRMSISRSAGQAAGVPAKVYASQSFTHIAVPTKGAVQMGFDAFGEASIVQLALPILQAAGFKGYHAGDTNLVVGSAGADLDTLYAAGWDVISQGGTTQASITPGSGHSNFASNPSYLSPDIDAFRLVWDVRFPRCRNLFAYPNSAENDTVNDIALSKGIQIARSGWGWALHPDEYGAGPKLLGHGGINMGGKTLTQMKRFVDMCVRYGVTINCYVHGLVAGGDGTAPPADTLKWFANDYQALVAYILAYVQAGLLDCDPPSIWLLKHALGLTQG